MNTFCIAAATALMIANQVFSPVAASSSSKRSISTNNSIEIAPYYPPPPPPDQTNPPQNPADHPTPPPDQPPVPPDQQASSFPSRPERTINSNYNGPYGYPYGGQVNSNTQPSYYAIGFGRINLSTNRAAAGDEVTVYVNGMPANAEIDIRIGRQDEDPILIYDGNINSDGTASLTFNIPSDAVAGERWVVHVLTTEQNGPQLFATIFIDE